MPRGGRRIGSGRKPLSPHVRAIRGLAAVPAAEIKQAPSPELLTVPACLAGDPVAVGMWKELAPLALERSTLTAGTSRALAELCRKFSIAEKLGAVEPGGTAHARMLKQINVEMLQFGLTPNGKPIFEAQKIEKPTNALSRFRRV